MSRLFILGNGFDIAHDLRTNYSYFYDYLKQKKRNDTLTYLDSIFKIRSREDCQDLETKMKNISPQIIATCKAFNLDENLLKAIKYEIEKDFVNWLIFEYYSVYNTLRPKYIFNKDDFFINFNYTTTLEDIYKISEDAICHIHGELMRIKIGFDGGFESRIHFDFGATARLNSNEYEHVFEKNIQKNIDCLNNLSPIFMSCSEIHIFGLSLNDADIPYFRIWLPIFKHNKIRLYYHTQSNKRHFTSLLKTEFSWIDVSESLIEDIKFIS